MIAMNASIADDGLNRLREQLLAAGWPATPNGHGLYVRCPTCADATVLVVKANTRTPILERRCANGCTTTDQDLRALADTRQADSDPHPRWIAASHGVAGEPQRQRLKAEETDAGNARRFAIDWQGDLRYVIGARWFVWDGRRWRPDDDGAAMRRSVKSARVTVSEATLLADQPAEDGKKDPKDASAARFRHAMTSQNLPRVKATLEIARTDQRFVTDPDDLDADDMALCVGTGVIDLATGALRRHDRRDLHTRLVPIAYDPDATCPRFEDFLATSLCGDADLIAWIQKATGYTATGCTQEQTVTILHGDGANGKSTFLNVLAGMFGEHCITVDGRTWTLAGADRAARSDIAGTRGRRCVISSEIPRGAELDETLFKQVSGGERISARFNRQDEFQFTPRFKLWIGANHLPLIHGNDHAIWRRLRIVPFHNRVTAPDLELGRRLHDELPGILAWAVRGALAWQREGLGTCTAIDAATAAYRREQDQVSLFVDERCRRDPRGSVRNAEIYDAYHAWATGHELPILDQKELGRSLTRLGFGTGKSNGDRLRKGLSL